jgi:hypothetical protein
MHVARSVPCVLWFDPTSGVAKAKPLPVGMPLRVGLPMGPKVPTLPPGSVRVMVSVLPYVLPQAARPRAAGRAQRERGELAVSHCALFNGAAV